jgi:hypothetical protein
LLSAIQQGTILTYKEGKVPVVGMDLSWEGTYRGPDGAEGAGDSSDDPDSDDELARMASLTQQLTRPTGGPAPSPTAANVKGGPDDLLASIRAGTKHTHRDEDANQVATPPPVPNSSTPNNRTQSGEAATYADEDTARLLAQAEDARVASAKAAADQAAAIEEKLRVIEENAAERISEAESARLSGPAGAVKHP